MSYSVFTNTLWSSVHYTLDFWVFPEVLITYFQMYVNYSWILEYFLLTYLSQIFNFSPREK